MYLYKIILFASLAVSVTALPTKSSQKRADLLQVQDYSEFQISDGVAGNALAEVAQKFPIDQFQANLAGVSKNDLAILNAAREAAEDAETGKGGFNDAIDQAGKDSDDGKALQVGKIKNKVLKLQLEVLALQIKAAQGNGDQSKITEEQTKLNNNVALDKASAGDQSQSVNFAASSQP
ncbi:hypothetical protein BGZ63DRAFT_425783 [Mariannaea sp. PMI_226]|nr:hypothetical protein BGZ63DRAFT_425783 [Mariannaea sp. PMI_226]